MISSEEISAWVVLNRRGHVFKDMTFEQIHAEIVEAMEDNSLLVDTDVNGYITGILIIEPRVHIKEILTVEQRSFGNLINIMRNMFPFVKTFQARRRGKLTLYKNPDYMINKIKNLKKETNYV